MTATNKQNEKLNNVQHRPNMYISQKEVLMCSTFLISFLCGPCDGMTTPVNPSIVSMSVIYVE